MSYRGHNDCTAGLAGRSLPVAEARLPALDGQPSEAGSLAPKRLGPCPESRHMRTGRPGNPRLLQDRPDPLVDPRRREGPQNRLRRPTQAIPELRATQRRVPIGQQDAEHRVDQAAVRADVVRLATRSAPSAPVPPRGPGGPRLSQYRPRRTPAPNPPIRVPPGGPNTDRPAGRPRLPDPHDATTHSRCGIACLPSVVAGRPERLARSPVAPPKSVGTPPVEVPDVLVARFP